MMARMVIVMGVAASGKTTVGEALAERMHCPFQEGDALHPPENIARMRAGHPLTDADRWPWLDRVAQWMQAHERGVISCSALKRSYRDRLRIAAPTMALVFLDPAPAELRRRIANRPEHFMPASLLDSQLATLEPPQADEVALRLDEKDPLEDQLDRVCAWLEALPER